MSLGRYLVLRAIGQGGMGHVFEVWDPQLERRVALKVLPAGSTEQDDDLALREARCLARVAHPNVVGVHEVGRCDDLVFIAMELVDGPDFWCWLCERPRRWMDVLDRLIEAARGLSAVHRAGLVHGDVKPANVLIGKDGWADGRVRIADFGLARVRSHGSQKGGSLELRALVRQAAEAELSSQPPPQSKRATLPGGTRAYMAPECLSGSESDRQSDQYSFCVMAWEALFGVRPYAGQTAEAILGSIAVGRLDRGHGSPRGMPGAIEAALRRGLGEDPDQRWADIDALIAELERCRWRGRGVVRRLVIGALAAGTVVAGLALVPARPQAAEVEQCTVEQERVDRAWGTEERVRFEDRMMRSSIVLPRREIRFVEAHLDGWVAEWSRLWTHTCTEEPSGDSFLRDCLLDERERLEAVVALLLDEQHEPSIEIGRALMAELELPTVCLDRARRAASARDLGHLGELSEFEHGIELALAGEDLQAATDRLVDLEARVDQLSRIDPPADAARVRVAYWQAQVLCARGQHSEARHVIEWALADAERLGLEHSRWDLLLARAHLSVDLGQSVLDEVAALDRLADRLGRSDAARAEVALVEASGSEDPLGSIARLDRSFDRLAQTPWSSSGALMFELSMARSKLQMRVANLDAAVFDAQQALALVRTPNVVDEDRIARALVLLTEIGARAGYCELLRTSLDDLRRAVVYDGRSSRHLDRALEILHSFEAPRAAECVDVQLQAWTMVSTSIGDHSGRLSQVIVPSGLQLP